MLVLSRQRDESVMIGDDVEVTVVDVRGEKVRLGIRAPRAVSVHRKEIYDAIRRENQSAAQLSPGDLPQAAVPVTPMKLAAADQEDGLTAALAEAQADVAEGGLPLGAALVKDGRVVVRGRDRRVQTNDPTAEAVTECMRICHQQNGACRPEGVILYCTHPLSALGAGVALEMGVKRIVVGDASHGRLALDWLVRQGVEVMDRRDGRCRQLVEQYMASHESLWRKWQS